MHRSIQLLFAVSLVAVGGAGTVAAVGSDGGALQSLAGGDGGSVLLDGGLDAVEPAEHTCDDPLDLACD